MSEENTSRRNQAIAIAVGLLVLVFLCMTCAFQVRVTEVAMVSTLGKPGAPIKEPGLYKKAPWPFQRVYVFDRRVQLYTGDYREVLTRDGLNLILKVYATWQISAPNLFYEWVGFQTEDGERILAGLLDKYASDVVGQHPLADLVSVRTDTDSPGLENIEDDIRRRIAKEVEKYGIVITSVGFEHLGLPETITKAVFKRMIAERRRLAEKIRSEGERDAKLIRTKADQLKAEKLSEAEGMAMRIRGEGESEAYKHFAVFDEAPDLALFLRNLEALEETLKNKTTIVLDRDIPPYDLLKPGQKGSNDN